MASSLSSLVALILWVTIAAAQEKVQVTVYFESYCPDSVGFLTKQLYPVYLTKLKDYMNVTLVPYGKANTTRSESGELSFSCHHGEKECKGNKVIACVLEEKNISFADQFKFINCASTIIAVNPKSDMDYPVDKCASGGISKDKVTECLDKDSKMYLEMFGNKTKEAFPDGLKSVPTIVFNDKFIMADHTAAVTNFRKALCSKITGTKPAECNNNAASGLEATVLPLLAAVYVASRV